ncbi:hypothetical protein E2C01_094727 [Portunus trituberculatus]|uniref:Secreted protein n=1 Tax=Portunus trituberculatus TaxID=210409 RepID=A0A5B7JR77_PORTR|nr:hypothetical protein [Portunus trituberculatus]
MYINRRLAMKTRFFFFFFVYLLVELARCWSSPLGLDVEVGMGVGVGVDVDVAGRDDPREPPRSDGVMAHRLTNQGTN